MSVAFGAAWWRPRSRTRLWLIASLGLIACVALALSAGAYGRLWAQWANGGAEVFWHIRLPRALLGVLAGAALGVAGALAQGLFRNPLADPGLIGVSAGAALGAATAIVAGGRTLGLWWGPQSLMVAAFLGSLLMTALTWRLARREGHVDTARLLLTGLALNAAAAAALGWLSFLATDEQLRSLTFWTLGSLSGSTWPPVLACGAVVAGCLVALGARRRDAHALDALALGEAQARLMGVEVDALQRRCLITIALMVGAVTALIGMVAFVGLLAPHAVRLLAGPRHGVVLPGSALSGAGLVLLADTGARTLVAPAEMPLGVLTGLVGAAVFLSILYRHRHLH